jgi:hypothetical protein
VVFLLSILSCFFWVRFSSLKIEGIKKGVEIAGFFDLFSNPWPKMNKDLYVSNLSL